MYREAQTRSVKRRWHFCENGNSCKLRAINAERIRVYYSLRKQKGLFLCVLCASPTTVVATVSNNFRCGNGLNVISFNWVDARQAWANIKGRNKNDTSVSITFTVRYKKLESGNFNFGELAVNVKRVKRRYARHKFPRFSCEKFCKIEIETAFKNTGEMHVRGGRGIFNQANWYFKVSVEEMNFVHKCNSRGNKNPRNIRAGGSRIFQEIKKEKIPTALLLDSFSIFFSHRSKPSDAKTSPKGICISAGGRC